MLKVWHVFHTGSYETSTSGLHYNIMYHKMNTGVMSCYTVLFPTGWINFLNLPMNMAPTEYDIDQLFHNGKRDRGTKATRMKTKCDFSRHQLTMCQSQLDFGPSKTMNTLQPSSILLIGSNAILCQHHCQRLHNQAHRRRLNSSEHGSLINFDVQKRTCHCKQKLKDAFICFIGRWFAYHWKPFFFRIPPFFISLLESLEIFLVFLFHRLS